MRRLTRIWGSLALTTRLTSVFAFFMISALAVGGVVTLLSINTYLTSQMDKQLSAAARIMGPNAANLTQYTSLYKTIPNDYYIYVHYLQNQNQPDREFITDSTKQDSGQPQQSYLPKEEDIPEVSSASSLVMRGTTVPSTIPGEDWRILSIMLTNKGEAAGSVTVGLSLAGQRGMMQAVSFTVFISTLIIAIIATLLTNLMVGKAFKPLHQIESVASQIAGGDLTKRIPPAPTTTEVGSLSNSLNVMLSNLEQAFSTVELSERKMRRFVSDASHELRTPTAAIRGYAELSRMGGVGPDRQAEVMSRIESEATRMGNMVQDLLTLARLDEHRPMVFQRSNITDLVRDAISDMAVLDPDRPVAMLNMGDENLEDVQSVSAVVDSEKISQVITNLLSNVRQHTPPATPVEVAVGYRMWPDTTGRNLKVAESSRIPAYQRCVIIEVRDHGPGVSPEDAQKVFERFYRADASRVRTTGGTGLGLAIVSGIVNAHNGTVAMIETPGGGATVRVKLPCQASHVDTEPAEISKIAPGKTPGLVKKKADKITGLSALSFSLRAKKTPSQTRTAKSAETGAVTSADTGSKPGVSMASKPGVADKPAVNSQSGVVDVPKPDSGQTGQGRVGTVPLAAKPDAEVSKPHISSAPSLRKPPPPPPPPA